MIQVVNNSTWLLGYFSKMSLDLFITPKQEEVDGQILSNKRWSSAINMV